MEELIKHLDVCLSNTHILDILRNNKNKIKVYNVNNYSFVFYKNIINTFCIIIKKLLNKICDVNGSKDKFPIFEEMTELIMKYSVFFTDELFTNEFVKFKKTITMKSLEFSADNGCISGFLLFAYIHPEMVSKDCYPYINYTSCDFSSNDNSRIVKCENIKNTYEKYSEYFLDKSKHIFYYENVNNYGCRKCGHTCNKYCDDECQEYFYQGEYYKYCKYCNEETEYNYCKPCEGECSYK